MDESNKAVPRRQAVGMMGMGMAEAAGPAAAQQSSTTADIPAQPTKSEPRAKRAAAIELGVKSLAKQLGPKGTRVNGVAPGSIWTPLQISGGAAVLKYTHFGNTTPLGRPGQATELDSIYVQPAASDTSFTTGNIYGAGGNQGQP